MLAPFPSVSIFLSWSVGERVARTFSFDVHSSKVRDEGFDVSGSQGVSLDGALQGIAGIFRFPLFGLASLSHAHCLWFGKTPRVCLLEFVLWMYPRVYPVTE